MKDSTLVGIAALGIFGYLLYNYLSKNTAIGQAVSATTGAINTLTSPIVKGQTSGVGAITPLQLAVPLTAVPNVLDTLANGTVGNQPWSNNTQLTPAQTAPSPLTALFPPLGIVEGITKLPTLITATKDALFGTGKQKTVSTSYWATGDPAAKVNVVAPASKTAIGYAIGSYGPSVVNGVSQLNQKVTVQYATPMIPSSALSTKLTRLV